MPANRRAAALDLAIVLLVFFVLNAAGPALDPLLRRGHGFSGLLALAAYQFALEGLAVLGVMLVRRERLSDYGFTRRNAGKSLILALVLAGIYNLALSWRTGVLLWIPFHRHTAMRMSLAMGFPLSLAGMAVMFAVWGFMEAFFGVFFARKLNQTLGHDGRGWFSPGAFGFALFNGLIHLMIGQGIAGFVASFASGYAIAVIPGATRNAWGSTLFQSLTNAVGK
ncbi:MAG TPA: hypothetical protein VEW69_11450 [Alphaproteobacteria bacterium]|nr:hypothetical protein [Alphaproteobacteria bacterium]